MVGELEAQVGGGEGRGGGAAFGLVGHVTAQSAATVHHEIVEGDGVFPGSMVVGVSTHSFFLALPPKSIVRLNLSSRENQNFRP